MSYLYSDDFMAEMPDGGVAWSGTIRTSDLALVCEVFNRGDGGPNSYVWGTPELRYQFEADASTKYAESFEPLDAFVAELWEQTLDQATF